MLKSLRDSAGFTLIEMTVVIGILAILATLAIPNIGNLTDTAKNTVQKANLKNLHTSMVSYKVDTNKGDGLYPDSLSALDINMDMSSLDYYVNDASSRTDYVVVTSKANSSDYLWLIEGELVQGSYGDPTTANADTDGDSNTDEVDVNSDGEAELESTFTTP